MTVNANASGSFELSSYPTTITICLWARWNATPTNSYNSPIIFFDNNSIFGPLIYHDKNVNASSTIVSAQGAGAGLTTLIDPGLAWCFYAMRSNLVNLGAGTAFAKLIGQPFTSLSITNAAAPMGNLSFFDEFLKDTPANMTFAYVKIWNELKSDDQIKTESIQGAPVDTRNLFAYYPGRSIFDPAIDVSGRKNNATKNGTFAISMFTPPVPEFIFGQSAGGVSFGGTDTPMTISVTQSGTASIASRALGLGKSGTNSQTLTRILALARTRSVTQTASPSSTKSVPKTISATETQTSSIARNVGAPKSATETQTPSIASRAIGAVKSGTETQTLARVLALGIVKSATETASPSGTKSVPKTISATETQTSSIARNVGASKSATETQAPTLVSKAVGAVKSATSAQTSSRIRSIGVAKSAGESGGASVSMGGANSLTLSATISQSLSMIKAIARTTSVAAAQTETIAKAVARTLTKTATATPSTAKNVGTTRLSGGTQTPSRGTAAIGKALSAVSAQSATLRRAIAFGRSISESSSPGISFGGSTFLTISTSISQAASMAKAVARTASVTASHVSTRTVGVAKSFSATSASVSAVGRGIARTALMSALQAPSRVRNIARGLFRSASSSPSGQAGQGAQFAMDLLATAVQVATVAYDIALKPIVGMIARQSAPPSTLIDIIGQCVDALDAMGRFMPAMVGKQYLNTGPGSAPRVIFVPEVGPGRVLPPYELGNAASVRHTCQIYIRASESGDDISRFRDVYELSDLVIDLVQTAGTGRIEWGDYGDGSPTDVDAYGAEIVISFAYRRDVRHNALRWGLPSATADTSENTPSPPPGVPAGGVIVIPRTKPS